MKNTNNVTFTTHKLNKGKIVTFFHECFSDQQHTPFQNLDFCVFSLVWVRVRVKQWAMNKQPKNERHKIHTVYKHNYVKSFLHTFPTSNNQLARSFGSVSLCHSGYANITWKRYKLHIPVCVSHTYLLCCYKKKRITYHFPIVGQPLLLNG